MFTPPINHGDSPQLLLSCIDPNTCCIDINWFMAYSQSLLDEAQQRTNTIIAQGYYSSDSRFRDDYEIIEDGETAQPKQKKKRHRKYVMVRRNKDGKLEGIKPTESFWYLYYIQCPFLEDDHFM